MTASPRDIVILGAGYAGLACALRLSALAPTLHITVVDARDGLCERIRLHQVAVGLAPTPLPFAGLLAGTGVAFVRANVIGIDRHARRVQTSAGELGYDRLVVALGSDIVPDVPGAAMHAHAVGSEAAAVRLRDRLALLDRHARVAVVGGGLTSIELASEIADARPDLEVHLLGRGALGEGLLHASAVTKLRRSFATMKVVVHEHFEVVAVEAARLVGRTASFDFDVCVWTAGFTASSAAGRAGLAVGNAGRMAVDATLRSITNPEIYGIGDAAEPIDDRGAPALMSCRLGLPAGAHAAGNLAAEVGGATLRPWRILDAGRCISLGRDDALVQLHHGDGRVRGYSVSGPVAAWIKERICRFTVWSLRRAAAQARRRQRALPATSPSTMVDAA